MCGIAAYFGEAKNLSVEKLKLLVLYNEQRGENGCGVYSNGSNTTTKEIGKPGDAILTDFPDVSNSSVVLCHTRQASFKYKSNSKVVEHLHPFVYGQFVGVHNGCIDNLKQITDKFEITDTIDVDSQILTYWVDKYKTLDILKYYKGAVAYICYDAQNNVTYFYRDKERPLFRGKIGNDIYVSSIENSLKAIGCTNIKSFKENVLYILKDNKISGSMVKREPIEPPKVEVIKSTVHSNYHWNKYERDDIGYTPRHTPPQRFSAKEDVDEDKFVEDIITDYKKQVNNLTLWKDYPFMFFYTLREHKESIAKQLERASNIFKHV